MAVPEPLAAYLDEAGVLSAERDAQHPCEGAKFHSPTPLVTRRADLAPWVEPPEPGDDSRHAWVCGTCADNLAMIQQLLIARNGEVPWPVLRCFGNGVRKLAMRGWLAYGDRLSND